MSPSATKNTKSKSKKRGRGWVIAAVLIGPVVVGALLARWSPVAIVLTVVAVIVLGLFVLIARPLPAVGLRTRTSGLATLGVAVLLVAGGGTAGAASRGPEAASTPQSFVDTKKPTASATPTPDPTTFDIVSEEVSVPFQQTTVDDPQRDQGTTAVTTAGVAGVTVVTYRITLVDGVETAREKISETVKTAPVDEVTAVGSKPPAPAAPVPLVQQGGGDCNANYTGACVPNASDVDCAGGSGDGPAYVQGPVRIVGSDPYDLDRDGDGIACDK